MMLGDAVLFAADDGTTGHELRITDGSPQGTFMVKDILPRTNSSNPLSFFNVGGTLLFTAEDGRGNRGLYRSDGSERKTELISPVAPVRTNAGVATRKLFIHAGFDSQGGVEPWRSDGTAKGTYRIADLSPGTASSFNTTHLSGAHFAAVRDTAFFIASNPTYGRELWVTDGTEAGTHVLDLTPGSGGSFPFNVNPKLTPAGNLLYFMAATTTGQNELWRTDGTTDGTWRIEGLVPTSDGAFEFHNGILYLVAEDPEAGRELWRTDGTPAGTFRLTDIIPGIADSAIRSLTAAGEYVFFTALSSTLARHLWRTDGTVAGTMNVAPLDAFDLFDYRGTLYFNVRTGGVWKSDGTPEGTERLWLGGGDSGLPPAMWYPVDVKGNLYFQGDVKGFWLFRSDGTTAGTKIVDGQETPAGSISTETGLLLDGNGTLFFRHQDWMHGVELWMVRNAQRPDPPRGLAIGRGGNALVAGNIGAPMLRWEPGDDMNGYVLERSRHADFSTIDATFELLANFTEFQDAIWLPWIRSSVASKSNISSLGGVLKERMKVSTITADMSNRVLWVMRFSRRQRVGGEASGCSGSTPRSVTICLSPTRSRRRLIAA
jgi:ELWxxDGT repeat protein